MSYTGHVGDGGLQGHSVGQLYPYAVVGRGTEPTTYEVHNLARGLVYTAGMAAPLRTTCAHAYAVASDIKDGHLGADPYLWESIK